MFKPQGGSLDTETEAPDLIQTAICLFSFPERISDSAHQPMASFSLKTKGYQQQYILTVNSHIKSK